MTKKANKPKVKQVEEQVIENPVPAYMVVQTEHKPHTMLEIRPNELSTIIGHNPQPALHGIVGLKAADVPDSLDQCDILVLTTDPECFRQLAQAFNMAADNLQAVIEAPPVEATNE